MINLFIFFYLKPLQLNTKIHKRILSKYQGEFKRICKVLILTNLFKFIFDLTFFDHLKRKFFFIYSIIIKEGK